MVLLFYFILFTGINCKFVWLYRNHNFTKKDMFLYKSFIHSIIYFGIDHKLF